MQKHSLFQSLFATMLSLFALAFGALIYFGYQDYVSPKHVYGSWIEINAPGYHTEVLTLSDRGVFRNNRLISTSFEYDGKKIEIKTGKGKNVYALAGTENAPQLKRIEPSSPVQRFIKQGFEDTLSVKSNSTEHRRNALSGYFGDN